MAAALGPPAQSAYPRAVVKGVFAVADLGDPIRVIEVTPLEAPVPREIPEPSPELEPAEDPVEVPA